MVSPVHILVIYIEAVHGLPRLRAPAIVPCIISFYRQLKLFPHGVLASLLWQFLLYCSFVEDPLICFLCCPRNSQYLSHSFQRRQVSSFHNGTSL